MVVGIGRVDVDSWNIHRTLGPSTCMIRFKAGSALRERVLALDTWDQWPPTRARGPMAMGNAMHTISASWVLITTPCTGSRYRPHSNSSSWSWAALGALRSDQPWLWPMKTRYMRSMNNTALLTAAVLGSVMLARCGNTPDEQKVEMDTAVESVKQDIAELPSNTASEEWKVERTAILTELYALRTGIELKLASTRERIATRVSTAAARAEEEAMRVELVRELSKVNDLIKNVEAATPTTWDTVKADTREATNAVNAWWKRLKDNVDKGTKADNDNDGH